MAIPEEDKQIARLTAEAIGGRPAVHRYHDDLGALAVDVLTVADRPWAGACAAATLGLSHHTAATVDGRPLGVELLAASHPRTEFLANALATCAFFILRGHPCRPGVVISDAVRLNAAETRLPHMLLAPQFLWPGAFATLDLPDRLVTWLLAIPISDAERRLAEERGGEALESALERAEIDVLDLARASVEQRRCQ